MSKLVVPPREYLKKALDPISADLKRQGTPHLLVGMLPGPKVLHVSCDATEAGTPAALREMANALLDYALQLEHSPKLIRPLGSA